MISITLQPCEVGREAKSVNNLKKAKIKRKSEGNIRIKLR